MKHFLVFALVLMVSMLASPVIYAQSEQDELLQECAKVFDEVNQMPEKAIPGVLLKNCTGIAIFPETFNFALGVGTRKGKGAIVYRDPDTNQWSNPAFFDVGGKSIGFQAGGQEIDLVLIIRSKGAFEGMLENKYNVGSKASLTIGPIGRNLESGLNLDTGESGGIYTYSRTKGLFVGSGLKTMKVEENKEANSGYYGQSLSVEEILYQSKGELDSAGKELIKVLEEYTK